MTSARSIESSAFRNQNEYGTAIGPMYSPGLAVARHPTIAQSAMILEDSAVNHMIEHFSGMSMYHDTASTFRSMLTNHVVCSLSNPETGGPLVMSTFKSIMSKDCDGRVKGQNVKRLREAIDNYLEWCNEHSHIKKLKSMRGSLSTEIMAVRKSLVSASPATADSARSHISQLTERYQAISREISECELRGDALKAELNKSQDFTIIRKYVGIIANNGFKFITEHAKNARIADKNVIVSSIRSSDATRPLIFGVPAGIVSENHKPKWVQVKQQRYFDTDWTTSNRILRHFETTHTVGADSYQQSRGGSTTSSADAHRLFIGHIHALDSLTKSFDLNEFREFRASIYCVPMIYTFNTQSVSSSMEWEINTNILSGIIGNFILTREHNVVADGVEADPAAQAVNTFAYLTYPRNYLNEWAGLVTLEASGLSLFQLNSDTQRRMYDILDAEEQANHDDVTGFGAKEERLSFDIMAEEVSGNAVANQQEILQSMDIRSDYVRTGTNPGDAVSHADGSVIYSKPVMQLVHQQAALAATTPAYVMASGGVATSAAAGRVICNVDTKKSTKKIRSRTTFPGFGTTKSFAGTFNSEHAYEFKFKISTSSAIHVHPRVNYIEATDYAAADAIHTFLGVGVDKDTGGADVDSGFSAGNLYRTRCRVASSEPATFVDDEVTLSLELVCYPQAFHYFLSSAMNHYRHFNVVAQDLKTPDLESGKNLDYSKIGSSQPISVEYGMFRDVTFKASSVTFATPGHTEASDDWARNILAWDVLTTSSTEVMDVQYHSKRHLDEFFAWLVDPYYMANRASLVNFAEYSMAGTNFTIGEAHRQGDLVDELMQQVGHGAKRVKSRYFQPGALTRQHDFTKNTLFSAWPSPIKFEIRYTSPSLTEASDYVTDAITGQLSSTIMAYNPTAQTVGYTGISDAVADIFEPLRELFVTNPYAYTVLMYEQNRSFNDYMNPPYTELGDAGIVRTQSTHARK